ncbi:hypothetical protein V8G54_006731 [Vigna mungo]|uniref:Uncharacterized protein n=1 Tax=Vigna mungo TaxID=3915 RepID=A0AAQ3P0D5_VIGMU
MSPLGTAPVLMFSPLLLHHSNLHGLHRAHSRAEIMCNKLFIHAQLCNAKWSWTLEFIIYQFIIAPFFYFIKGYQKDAKNVHMNIKIMELYRINAYHPFAKIICLLLEGLISCNLFIQQSNQGQICFHTNFAIFTDFCLLFIRLFSC